ncbi:MAG: AAA family ATPase, partial [Clostridium sp.]
MKRIKMLLYGEPGVGKSVFAVHAPKPFFICTDGNYEWLDEFGAKDEAHINVSSWSDMKNAMLDAEKNDYETIVVDLVEDGFKWCEQEY